MADPKETPFLDDPEAMEEEFDLDAAMDEEPDDTAPRARADAPARPDVDAIAAERDEMRDRLMRALAETENVRKRAARDRVDAEKYGSTKLARDLLPIYDNLQRALEAAGDEKNGITEGIELTIKELVGTLARHGVTLIAPQQGDRFDPQVHQAMFEAPVPGTRAGEIIQVATVGFLLHDRLLRPAQVGVSSTPAS
jgi:molecular chaperone GrpE